MAPSRATALLGRVWGGAHGHPRALVAFVTIVVVAGLVIPVVPGSLTGRTLPAAPSGATIVVPVPPPAATSSVHAPPIAGPTLPPELPARSVSLGGYSSSVPHPAAWGASGVPPGAEALNRVLRASDPGAGPTPNWENRLCAGVWPWNTSDESSQSYYAAGCYGHDEPGIQFYSALPGGGGNVTWNLTLPTDRSPTQNQSDLYITVWLGMTLTDPLAWMHMCFLELQFYPDQSFTNPGPVNPNWTVNGQWIGATVAWQIESATGGENPCFYQPLYLGNATSGNSFLNMSDGDRLSITMTGWVGSPYGENISVRDLTQSQDSSVNLWDPFGDFPLNPAYPANNVENGLQWTPGGEYPVVAAFELAHVATPGPPNTNLYGGCSPGKPPATLQHPSVPCPSYDSSAWANNTLSPWQIEVPTFFNATTIDHPTQVAFTQDFGGVATLSEVGEGACDGQIGSAYCTYPWYSYSCLTHAFNYGATNYPGESADFGKYYQYSQNLEFDGVMFGFYPPTNFSVPTCGQASYTVSVSTSGVAGGSIYFLSQDTPSGTFPGLLPGNYSIYPYVPPGAGFDHWITTGGVTVLGSPEDMWATLQVLGDGSVAAVFVLAPTTTTVTFLSTGATSTGRIVLSPQRLFTDGVPIGTFADGASISLAPGIYGILGLAPVGGFFTRWSSSGASVSVTPIEFPYAWLDVTAAGGTATVTAHFSPSTATASMALEVTGAGNMTFASTTTNATARVDVTVGSYAILAVPDPGWAFGEWEYFSTTALTQFTAASNVSVENGSAELYAIFVPIPALENVTLDDAPISGGMIALGSPIPSSSGTVVPIALGVAQLLAFPSGGFAFSSWSVSDSSAAWINGTAWNASVLINDSVTITATFVPAPTGSLAFAMSPATAGFISFNGAPYFDSDANGSVAAGTYLLNAYPFPGWQFLGLSVTGGVSLLAQAPLGSYVRFDGTTGTVTAMFAPILLPISFAATAQTGVSLRIDGTTLPVGGTAWLAAGTYSIALTYASAIESFLDFTTSPGLLLGNPNATSTTVTFSPFSPGTIIAVLDGPLLVGAFTATPPAIDLGGSTTLSVRPHGGTGPYGYAFSSLPPGCAGPGPSITCTPTAIGTTSVGVTLTDVFGLSAQATTTVSVSPLPSIATFSVAPSEIDVGMTTTFTATVSGGTTPFLFGYVGLPAGCASTNSPTLFCSPTDASLSLVGVIVVDAYGFTANSAVTLTIDPAVVVSSLSATRTNLDVGTTTVLTGTGTGTGALTYAWTGLPNGCSSANAASIACTPTAAGASTVVLTISDAIGGAANQSLVLRVAVVPSAAATVSPSTVDPGGTAWVNVTASGGTGDLAYSFADLPPGCASANTSSLACTPTGSGTFTITVTVADALHQAANATAVLTVTGASGTPAPLAGLPSSVLAGIVLVVVVLVALVVVGVMRRRTPKPPPEPVEEPLTPTPP